MATVNRKHLGINLMSSTEELIDGIIQLAPDFKETGITVIFSRSEYQLLARVHDWGNPRDFLGKPIADELYRKNNGEVEFVVEYDFRNSILTITPKG